jgi:hypothetical protein
LGGFSLLTHELGGTMTAHSLPERAREGGRIVRDDIEGAVTAAQLVYEDGSTQVFDPDGTTTYVERGRETAGEWYVDEHGRFCSFWPPSYRACYDLEWVVEAGEPAGVSFREVANGSTFVGRYRH